MHYKRLAPVTLWAAAALAQNSFTITTIAGANSAGDGGAATSASFSAIEGLTVDGAGNVYIADAGAHRIRRVAPNGLITTVTGSSSPGYSPDDTLASKALVNAPYGVSAGPAGHLFLADLGNALVRCVTPGGLLRTVVGGLTGPRNVAADAYGNLLVSDYAAHRVHRVDASGQATVLAGSGEAGFDAEPSAVKAKLRGPAGVAVDSTGAVYIADSGNGVVRRVFGGQIATLPNELSLDTPTGLAVDAAGNLYIADPKRGRVVRRARGGEMRAIAPAGLGAPRDVAVDAAGNLFVAESRRVWRIDARGNAAAVAGMAENAPVPDGVAAARAVVESPMHVWLDAAGGLLITEERGRRVRRVGPDGLIRTVTAGAPLIDPVATVSNSSGVVFVADYTGNRVYSVTSAGTTAVIAGDGTGGYRGDNALAVNARLNRPRGLAIDRAGNLYIADSLNHRVRRIGANGVITTIAGTGARGFGGDGRLATLAQLNTPLGLHLDAAGALYIADSGNHRIRRVAPNGFISTVAGNGAAGDEGDGALAIQAALHFPAHAVIAPDGSLWIADTFNHRIRRVDPGGIIETVAGDGTPGADGEDESAQAARFRFPVSLAADASGAVYVADHDNNLVRKLTPVAPPPDVRPPKRLEVLHGATLEAGPFAPGQLVSIPGLEAGAPVTFDGRPARAAGSTYHVLPDVAGPEVTARSGDAASVLRMQPAAPGVFTVGGVGQAAAVNEDGSANSADAPAPRGSVLAIYATGLGADLARVEVFTGLIQAEVLHAGPAPGLPGVSQINIRLPGVFTPPGVRPLIVWSGGVASQGGVSVVVR